MPFFSARNGKHAGFAPVLLILALFESGCQKAGPTTYEVSGMVTWNGSPITDGQITFEAADGSPVADSGAIVAGKYRFLAKPGKKRVLIIATRETGKIDPVMQASTRESYIPEKYNTQTTLFVQVGPESTNQWDFPLTGK
jgi:hypothetical protein